MRGFSIVSLCMLTACASPKRGDVRQVLVRAPAKWSGADTDGKSDSKSDGKVDGDWWQRLGDADLTRAIRRTLAKNHDLQAAQARLAAAATQAHLAGAALWPTLDAGGLANRQRNVFVGLPTGFSPGSEPLANTFSSFGVNLNAAWEIDLWGRIRKGLGAATAELRATAQDLRGLRQSLAAQTAKAWFAAVEARQQIQLAHTTAASYLETEQQVERRFQRGVRSALDLRLARSRRLTAEALEHFWGEQYERAVRQLEVLQGEYPDGRFAVADQLPQLRDPVPAGLPAELVRRRPDLIAAEQRLLAAGFRVDEAQAALYPSLNLNGQFGTTSDRTGDLLDLDFLIWNAAANLLAPIFRGGELRGQVDLAAARENEVIANFAQTALRAYSEVETLLAADKHLRRQEESLVAASTEATTARSLAEDRYRRGVDEFLAVLVAQRSALMIDGQLLSVRRLLLDLRVDLHLALGGGFELSDEESDGEIGDSR